MPNVTKNYGLKKPTSEEFYDIDIQNQNMDVIDEEMNNHNNNKNNPHNVTREQIGAAPAYTYGTEDIEAGSASPYATGHLHFVIE